MILREKDKRHAEAIIKICTDNGMIVEATGGLWNHICRLFKKFELIEDCAAKSIGAQPTHAPNNRSTKFPRNCCSCPIDLDDVLSCSLQYGSGRCKSRVAREHRAVR
jgi:hypothetical protein